MAMVNYNCFNCGAELTFNPKTQRWDCAYCGESFSLEDFEKRQAAKPDAGKTDEAHETWAQTEATDDSSGDMVAYHCAHCGAEIVTSRETVATTCVYCQRPVVLEAQMAGAFRPQYVLPFAKTREDAVAAFREYVKKKPLLPREFTGEQAMQKITGVYVPFWLFNCGVDTDLTADCRNVTSWSDGDYRYTKTDYYRVVRSGQIAFRNIPVDASSKIDNATMDSIEPFPFQELVDFAPPYLSGFLAERYDEDTSAAAPRATSRAGATAMSELRGTIHGYSTTIVTSSNQQFNDLNAWYTLLPVWLLSCEFKGKPYLFAMNGRTGKFTGNLPIDGRRALLYTLLTFLICAGAAALVLLLLWLIG